MGNLKIPEKASLWFKVIPSERNSKPIYVCQKNNQENLLSVQSRIGRFCRPYQGGWARISEINRYRLELHLGTKFN